MYIIVLNQVDQIPGNASLNFLHEKYLKTGEPVVLKGLRISRDKDISLDFLTKNCLNKVSSPAYPEKTIMGMI